MFSYKFSIAETLDAFEAGKYFVQSNISSPTTRYLEIEFQAESIDEMFAEPPTFRGSELEIEYFKLWADGKLGEYGRCFRIDRFCARTLYEVLVKNRDQWCFEIETDDDADFDTYPDEDEREGIVY